tara:strand:+ start:1804 stop:1923 length:120 start_codon:yes stop_codon:yes gene_type:complete
VVKLGGIYVFVNFGELMVAYVIDFINEGKINKIQLPLES